MVARQSFFIYNNLFLDIINVSINDITQVTKNTSQNPCGLLAKGNPGTFIPKNPETIVEIDIISVIEVKNCITVFWLLLTIALKASIILLSISPLKP